MSQGILERLESKMDLLIAKLGTQVEGVLLETAQFGDAITAEEITQAKINAGNLATVPQSPINIPVITPTVVNNTTTEDDLYAGVDKDGVRWDKRIHSKAAEPKSQTTGKWKKRKGLKEGVYEAILAELKAEEPVVTVPTIPTSPVKGPFFWQDSVTKVHNTVETRAEMDKLLLIPSTTELTREQFDSLIAAESTPTIPTVPKVPGVPTVPKAPIELAAKPAVLMLIKEMSDTYDVEPNDIDQLMLEITGGDTIAKLDETQLNDFKAELEAWKLSLDEAFLTIGAINTIAKASGNEAAATAGVLEVLAPHDAEQIGHLHYSAINGVKDTLAQYLTAWQGA